MMACSCSLFAMNSCKLNYTNKISFLIDDKMTYLLLSMLETKLTFSWSLHTISLEVVKKTGIESSLERVDCLCITDTRMDAVSTVSFSNNSKQCCARSGRLRFLFLTSTVLTYGHKSVTCCSLRLFSSEPLVCLSVCLSV